MPSYNINVEYGVVDTPNYIVIDVGGAGIPVDPPDPVFAADFGGLWGINSITPPAIQNLKKASARTMEKINQCRLLVGRFATELQEWSYTIRGNVFGYDQFNALDLYSNQRDTAEQNKRMANNEMTALSNSLSFSALQLDMIQESKVFGFGHSDLLSASFSTPLTLRQLESRSFFAPLKLNDICERAFLIASGGQAYVEICDEYPSYYVDGKYTINVNTELIDQSVINVTSTDKYQICRLIQRGDSFPIFNETELPGGEITPPTVITPSIKGTYTMSNTIQCFRLSDNLEINVISGSVSLDNSQSHFVFNINVGSRADAINIEGNEFRLVINGEEFRGVADDKGESRQFNSDGYSVSAVSLTSVLSEPTAIKRSKVNGSASTWRQLIEDEVTGSGITVEYEDFYLDTNLDWTVPAGAFSYIDLTPMQAIRKLCEVVSATVISSKLGDKLIIKPRYRAPLWDLQSQPEDYLITEDHVTNISITPNKPLPIYNKVTCEGEQFGGRYGVKRAGSDGLKEKAQIVRALFTDLKAAHERALVELSNVGKISTARLTTPILIDWPIVDIGKILLFSSAHDSFKYITTAISISFSRSSNSPNEVSQTITMVRRSDV